MAQATHGSAPVDAHDLVKARNQVRVLILGCSRGKRYAAGRDTSLMTVDELVLIIDAHHLHAPGQGGLPTRKQVLRLLLILVPLLQIGTLMLRLMLAMANGRSGRAVLLVEVVVDGHLLVLVGDAGHARRQLVPFGLLTNLRLHSSVGCLGHLLGTLILPNVLLHRSYRFIGICGVLGGAGALSCDLGSSVTLGFDLADGVDFLRVHLLDILGQLGIVVTGALIVYRFLVQLNAFSDGDSQGKRLVMLLESTIFPRIEHFLISVTLLREQAFENVVCSFFVNVLTADRVDAGGVGPWTRVKPDKSLPSRLVWQSECTRVKCRFFELGLLNDRFAEEIHIFTSFR